MRHPESNAPATVTLDDKYTATQGHVYISGTQLLVRLPMLQRERDHAQGLNTAGFISGYRGSPLGGYDQALQKAAAHLERHHVTFMPGVNEELAATAVWGTQQANLKPGGRYDGVFGLWYGKGPGVDRCADALRHANQAGTAPHGGVLALAGDDHSAKSSTMAAQTDHVFQAVSIPVLAPATLQDILDFGLHGIAMSRFSGLWVGVKLVTDCVESTGMVDVSPDRVQPVLPADVALPPGGLNIRWPEAGFVAMEERLNRHKLPAALAYARANRLDRTHFPHAGAKRGIVTSGKAFLDVMQALADLGIDAAAAAALGVKVYQVAMPWPLEPQGLAEFAAGCEELLVVEEKRDLIEGQVKQALYGQPGAPRVIGKRDGEGRPLLPDAGELDPALVAGVIARWLGVEGGAAAHRLSEIAAAAAAAAAAAGTGKASRTPYFCSGCPHNTSTRVPEGSRAMAGIGCHFMAHWMDRETETFTHMGGEGANWVGQSRYVETPHVFQNLGDGTYFHSGYLAIRQAVAAGSRMTYKILFNDAVAMTGGQEHDGPLTPAAIARQVLAEGVREVVVVTDEPGKYPEGWFPPGVPVHGREELDAVQRRLREVAGVTVLIYDQTCAAEKRRRRKKAAPAQQPRRAFINAAVCEGCGDCGVQSNCVSIEPLETELGRKRRINQSSCNQDLSCVKGFCPSFVTVSGGRLKKPEPVRATAAKTLPRLAEPAVPPLTGTYRLLVTGIGGTGVITIGQVLGMAAHLEGKAANVLDMTGMAQKGGAVMSHVQLAAAPEHLRAPKIAAASADAVIGCDLLVTGSTDVLARLKRDARVVVNTNRTPTGEFTRDTEWELPAEALQAAIVAATGESHTWPIDAGSLATALLGDAMATNLFLLGVAFQKGMVPLAAASIERAIELNGVAVAMNLDAFRWGRAAGADLAAVEAAARPAQVIRFVPRQKQTLAQIVAHRTGLLAAYQDAGYARRYATLVERVAAADAPFGSTRLAEAVARSYAKLLAYKDEYEVARLYADPRFAEELGRTFEGDLRLTFNLAPPLLPGVDAAGRPRKREFGAWMLPAFRLLARLKGLRGTPLDVFGYSEERREERRLIVDYERTVGRLLEGLTTERLDLAVRIASLPEKIRGFGPVKEKAIAAHRAEQAALLADFERVAIQPERRVA